MHLFDSFEGMPETNPTKDFHRAGDFNDTTLDAVQAFLGPDKSIKYHKDIKYFCCDWHRNDSFRSIDLDISERKGCVPVCL